MTPDRARELWAVFLRGGDLSSDDERGLLDLLERDADLRDELLEDADLDGLLTGLGRGRSDAEGFARYFRDLLGAERDAGGFMTRVRSRMHAPARRYVATGRSAWKPILAAAAVLFAVGAALLLSIPGETPPEPSPEPPVIVDRPAPVVPASKPGPTPAERRAPRISPAPPTPLSPVPKPPPTPKPDVTPVPPKPEPPKPPRRTRVAVAALKEVEGRVTIVRDGRRLPARKGSAIERNDSLETAAGARAVFTFTDASRIELAGSAFVRSITDRVPPQGGKRMFLARGALRAEVPTQPRPMVLETPQGEARVIGTILQLTVVPEFGGATRLDVHEGKVRLTRKSDGARLDVSTGHHARMGPGIAVLRPRRGVPGPGTDLAAVETAIARAAAWFLQKETGFTDPVQNAGSSNVGIQSYAELAALALAATDRFDPENDPACRKLLKTLLTKNLVSTYTASLQAMALAELDPVKYRARIAQCAQFLVDNQCANGQWSYGTPTDLPAVSAPPRKGVRIRIRQLRTGPAKGDNSNTQFAAAGLRACAESGIVLDRELLVRAHRWWQEGQNADGGWGYEDTGTYTFSTGSQTAGALAALAVYARLLGENVRAHPSYERGIRWLRDHFEVTQNPEGRGDSHFYYLWALERTCTIAGFSPSGDRDGYARASAYLLSVQRTDGTWQGDVFSGGRIGGTSFAMLVLGRATKPFPEKK